VCRKVDFIITSLGSPEETIKAHKVGIKVFVLPTCLLPKSRSLGADALIG
jgi:nitronate monooxygenase